MKKFIYTAGKIALILFAIFFTDLSGGKDGGLTASGTGADINVSAGTPIENHTQPGFSPRSGGWQLQTMPNMGNRLVRDLYFTDSLTGYAVASPDTPVDSAHILKTTDGGTVWQKILTKNGRLKRIVFINSNTGFAGGSYLLKTTNSGGNWNVWNWPLDRIIYDMQVFSEDTIWYGDTDPIAGGAYRTTNGGINWEKRDSGIPSNAYPDKIYFYNSRIGFTYHGGMSFGYKTTDGGGSWFQIIGTFTKMQLLDSLFGYKASQGFFRTTDGGLNWSKDSLPSVIGNVYTRKWITDFFSVNNNTIYAVGASIQFLTNFIYKSIVYKTTNGGLNWGYQIPDTSFGSAWYDKTYAINNNVWAYTTYNNKGIYSTTGGDSTIYVGINSVSSDIPSSIYILQNYPNPFNPFTKIKFGLSKSGNISFKIYDISGKTIKEIIKNSFYHAGEYEYIFDGSSLSSGIYLYQLSVNSHGREQLISRKMLMIK